MEKTKIFGREIETFRLFVRSKHEIPNMIIQLRIIAGLLYIAVVRIENTFCAKQPCKVENLRANCSSRGFDDIPQNLDMNLMDLDASHNPIEILTADAFKRYPKLLTLNLRGIAPAANKETTYHRNVFVPLTQLAKLDISESGFELIYTTEFIWPKTLRCLAVSSMKYSKFFTLNLSSLSALEELYAGGNKLESFPTLHPQAPIVRIDLRNNPLNNVTAEHLAPYCLLKNLDINVAKGGLLNTRLLSCPCRRLESWMLMNSIKGFDFSCYILPPIQNDECPVKKFSDAMWDQQRQCFNRQPTSSFWKWLILLAVLSLIVPCIYGGIEGYKYYKKRKAIVASDDSAATPSNDTSSDANDAPPVENQESAPAPAD